MNARRAMTEIFPLRYWPSVPASYIFCREGRTVRPVWARISSTRAIWSNRY
jgi:hypothetical protein